MKKYLQQFIECHEGAVNRIIHVIGISTIIVGLFQRSLVLIIGGGLVQESGHFYQYFKTRIAKYSPLFCVKPQLIFAYPLFGFIIIYVLLTK